MTLKPPFDPRGSESTPGNELKIEASAEDVAWQRRARELDAKMSFVEYLEWISQEHAPIEELRKRKLPIGYEFFKL